MYKPDGYLSQFIYDGRKKNKKLLGELYDFPAGTMAIGRLDEDSEGLLLLTTDGKKSYAITKGGVEKEYYVQVDGLMTPEALERLENGVEISIQGKSYLTKPAKARRLSEEPRFPEKNKSIRSDRHGPTSWISVTLTEGKYRQIRKMTAVVGFPTLRLVRVRIGDITLEGMEKGKVRELQEFELK